MSALIRSPAAGRGTREAEIRATRCAECGSLDESSWCRRGVLAGIPAWAVAAAGWPWGRGARAEDGETDPKRMRPQPGDRLAFSRGKRKGEVIAPGDIELAAKPTFAFPYDPAGGVLRNGTRLNQVLVLRLADDVYTDEVKERSAGGVIAYSAVCTHEKCTVIGWHREDHVFICPCHETNFDPKDGARVLSGPARRPLPALPLKIVDDALTVADVFTGRVGGRRTS